MSLSRTVQVSAVSLSFSELASSTERLSSGEAVALVLAAINAWEGAGGPPDQLPSPDGLVLGSDGTVSLSRPLCGDATGDAAAFFATLVWALLPLRRGHSRDRRPVLVPGALLLLLARASGDSELPRATLTAFRIELARFHALDRNDLALVYDRVRHSRRRRDVGGRAAFPLYRRVVTRRGTIAASLALLIVAGYVSAIRYGGVRPTAPAGLDRVTVTITDEPASTVHESEAIGSSPPARSTSVWPSAAQNALAPRPLLPANLVGADVFSPSFARNGQTVLFHAGRRQSALMQATFDQDGPPAIAAVVRDGAANYHGTISPDGEWLAFDSDRDGIRGVYVSRVTGLDARRVSGDGYASVPTWSPDGHYLAFAKAETARPRLWNVWVVDVRTGTLRRLSRHRVGQAWGASWFPDANRLAYSVEDTLVVVNLEDGARRAFRAPQSSRLIRTPAVSPDGARIIFQLSGDGAWVLEVPTGRMQRVLADASAEEFAWSPDGSRVLFHARRRGAWSVWELPMTPDTRG